MLSITLEPKNYSHTRAYNKSQIYLRHPLSCSSSRRGIGEKKEANDVEVKSSESLCTLLFSFLKQRWGQEVLFSFHSWGSGRTWDARQQYFMLPSGHHGLGLKKQDWASTSPFTSSFPLGLSLCLKVSSLRWNKPMYSKCLGNCKHSNKEFQFYFNIFIHYSNVVHKKNHPWFIYKCGELERKN